MLVQGSSRPLYCQLAEIMREKIAHKEWNPGDKLPGERKLMEHYNVSRITIRQAIKELVNEHMVYSCHGQGTFVAQTRLERPLAKLYGFAEELGQANLDPEIAVIGTGVEKPSSEVAQALRLGPDENVYSIIRVISALGGPLLIDYGYLPEALSHIFATANLQLDLIYKILEHYGIRITGGEQSIEAGECSAEDAKLLGVKRGMKVLVVSRTTFAQEETPIFYSKAIYRGDRYAYKLRLER